MPAWEFTEDDELSRLVTARAERLNPLFKGISDAFAQTYTKTEVDELELGTANLADNSVTFAKIAEFSTYTVLGNLTGSTADGMLIPVSNDSTLAAGSQTSLVTEYAVKAFVASTAFSTALPAQIGNDGKFVTTNAGMASWVAITYNTVQPFSVQTGNFNAAAFTRYLCNTAGGAITVTLPPAPTNGDSITIRRRGANDVIVARNGKTIAGLSEDMTITFDKREAVLDYWNNDWMVVGRATA